LPFFHQFSLCQEEISLFLLVSPHVPPMNHPLPTKTPPPPPPGDSILKTTPLAPQTQTTDHNPLTPPPAPRHISPFSQPPCPPCLPDPLTPRPPQAPPTLFFPFHPHTQHLPGCSPPSPTCPVSPPLARNPLLRYPPPSKWCPPYPRALFLFIGATFRPPSRPPPISGFDVLFLVFPTKAHFPGVLPTPFFSLFSNPITSPFLKHSICRPFLLPPLPPRPFVSPPSIPSTLRPSPGPPGLTVFVAQ